jgi:hypothetical protein
MGALLLCLASGLAGCLKPPEERFETKLSAAELQQARRECAYEAEKATAAIKPGYAHYSWTRVFGMCLGLKGVTYIGPYSARTPSALVVVAVAIPVGSARFA